MKEQKMTKQEKKIIQLMRHPDLCFSYEELGKLMSVTRQRADQLIVQIIEKYGLDGDTLTIWTSKIGRREAKKARINLEKKIQRAKK